MQVVCVAGVVVAASSSRGRTSRPVSSTLTNSHQLAMFQLTGISSTAPPPEDMFVPNLVASNAVWLCSPAPAGYRGEVATPVVSSHDVSIFKILKIAVSGAQQI